MKKFKGLFLVLYPDKNTLSVRQSKKYKYFVVKELISGKEYGCDDFEMDGAYNPEGLYLGDKKTALYLTKKKGITLFERVGENDNIASIGFNSIEQKWYGWSHRAINGFGIGSEVKKGDCAYMPPNEEDFIEDAKQFWSGTGHEDIQAKIVEEWNDEMIRGVYVSWVYSAECSNKSIHGQIRGSFEPFPKVYGKGEWVAETLEDAKQMAKNFAGDVS